MLKKRIIPCLDIKGGRTVKGVRFKDLKDAGDSIALATSYEAAGADELVFLDISATEEQRQTLLPMVAAVAKQLSIPFTVGGGVASVADAGRLLEAGADKIAVNSAAVKRPELIRELATRFGSQAVVLAVDVSFVDGKWMVYIGGGKVATGIALFHWLQVAEEMGAGELLLTSMDHDGTKKGFANDLLAKVSEAIQIPVIASGGAGGVADFCNVFTKGKADAALAAGIFHFGTLSINTLKTALTKEGVAIRQLS